MTGYIEKTDIKKKTMAYLKKTITDETRFENLTRESIVKALNVPESRLKEALDELESDGEIIRKESGHVIYIPTEDEKSDNLKKFKLGNVGEWYTKRLTIGMVIELIIVQSFFPNLAAAMFSINNATPASFLLIVFFVGLIVPTFLGLIFTKAYNYVLNWFLAFTSGLGLGNIVNRQVANVATILIILLLALYIMISWVWNRSISPFEIIAIIAAGFTSAGILTKIK